MSSQLHKCFLSLAQQQIQLFESRGGVLTYSNGFMYIEAPSTEQINSFTNNVIMRYSERTIAISEQQWDELMSDGSKRYKVLVLPFETNTLVKILPLNKVSSTLPQLLIIGVKEAVDSAHKYLWNYISKEVRVDNRLVIVVIVPVRHCELQGYKLYSESADGSSDCNNKQA